MLLLLADPLGIGGLLPTDGVLAQLCQQVSQTIPPVRWTFAEEANGLAKFPKVDQITNTHYCSAFVKKISQLCPKTAQNGALLT
jgi:hypothetical protein